MGKMDAEIDLLLYQVENGSTVDAGKSVQKSTGRPQRASHSEDSDGLEIIQVRQKPGYQVPTSIIPETELEDEEEEDDGLFSALRKQRQSKQTTSTRLETVTQRL